MNRGQLQHVILEVGRRFDLETFYIIGSAAIFAAVSDVTPGELTATRDVDIIPLNDDPALIDRIDFVLGEASDFDDEYGYYVQGASSRTPSYAPRSWQQRCIPVRVETYIGLCMEPHDLVLSKLGAGREKDLDFVRAAFDLAVVDRDELLGRVADIDCPQDIRDRIEERIRALAK